MVVGRTVEPLSYVTMDPQNRVAVALVEKLGGQERAARRLAIYLKVPAWAQRRAGGCREQAAVLMGRCGKWGLMRIIPMLESTDEEERMCGYLGLCALFKATHPTIGFRNPGVVLDGLDPETRELAVKALILLDKRWAKVLTSPPGDTPKPN
jgi:hypothetical protein